LRVTRGRELNVSALDKVYFPDDGVTKGDVMRYYATLAPIILPRIADRPLVLKRTPDGIAGEMFFQQNAGEHVPAGVRVEEIADTAGDRQRRFIGGDLMTLLYTVQLGCISVDPWMSRVTSLDTADYAIIDLDPGPGVTFGRVVAAARWINQELTQLGLRGVPKTSGSRGIHVALPLPAGASYDTALAIAQLVAGRVVEAHSGETTMQRALQNRPHGTVYLDCIQNMRGKSVVAVYAVRARKGATVSTPLAWDEVTPTLDLRAFTMATIPDRVARLGDLWGPAMQRRNSARALRAAAQPRDGPRSAVNNR
jgi:bifunctional non-homologous end joining protein LigD